MSVEGLWSGPSPGHPGRFWPEPSVSGPHRCLPRRSLPGVSRSVNTANMSGHCKSICCICKLIGSHCELLKKLSMLYSILIEIYSMDPQHLKMLSIIITLSTIQSKFQQLLWKTFRVFLEIIGGVESIFDIFKFKRAKDSFQLLVGSFTVPEFWASNIRLLKRFFICLKNTRSTLHNQNRSLPLVWMFSSKFLAFCSLFYCTALSHLHVLVSLLTATARTVGGKAWHQSNTILFTSYLLPQLQKLTS